MLLSSYVAEGPTTGSMSTKPRHPCSTAGRFADNAAPHHIAGVASPVADLAQIRCTVTATPMSGTRTLN
jgi:hypothetical protein